LQEVQAEKEAKRADKLAKREAKRAAGMATESKPPVVCVPIAANMDGLPVVCAVPMCTPVPMPNLARAAAVLGADMV
jgi:phosphoribosylcarboxyaminoimidazole (NCAIR) mutase